MTRVSEFGCFLKICLSELLCTASSERFPVKIPSSEDLYVCRRSHAYAMQHDDAHVSDEETQEKEKREREREAGREEGRERERQREGDSFFLVLAGCKSGTPICLKLLLYSG